MSAGQQESQEMTQPGASKIELARALLRNLEEGAEDEASDTIAQLAGFRDNLLFKEVGRMTRELHESLKSFVVDSQLTNIATHEMPDATERLQYVIDQTEQAANTTLEAVESALPVADELRGEARALAEKWKQFNSSKMSLDDFRAMNSELGDFLDATQHNSEALHAKLTEILMAQGFQDLTGQIIRKVITMVSEVEIKLIELVRIAGTDGQSAEDIQEEKAKNAMGPVVPNVEHGDVVSGQDDVDDLLSSLGF